MDNLERLRLNNNQLTGEWCDKQWNENRTLVALEVLDHSERIFLDIEFEEGDEFEPVREVAVVHERGHARMDFNDVSILAVNFDTTINLDGSPRQPGQVDFLDIGFERDLEYTLDYSPSFGNTFYFSGEKISLGSNFDSRVDSALIVIRDFIENDSGLAVPSDFTVIQF